MEVPSLTSQLLTNSLQSHQVNLITSALFFHALSKPFIDLLAFHTLHLRQIVESFRYCLLSQQGAKSVCLTVNLKVKTKKISGIF